MNRIVLNPAKIMNTLLADESIGLDATRHAREFVEIYNQAIPASRFRPCATEQIDLEQWMQKIKDSAPKPCQNVEKFTNGVESEKLAAFLVLQSAPEGMTHGVALHRYSNASNCHEDFRVIAHRVHAWMVGDGELIKNQAAQFRNVAESVGHYLPEVVSNEFYETINILRASWELAAYRCCLSIHPNKFSDEILGAVLFELDNPIPLLLSSFVAGQTAIQTTRYSTLRSNRLSEMRGNCISAIEARLCGLGKQNSDDPKKVFERLSTGYLVSSFLQNRAVNAVCDALAAGYLDSDQEMYRLVERKGRHAQGYHSSIKLAGVPFDELISSDPADFLTALAGSPWIKPQNPSGSRLLKLLEFEQPMFRVFSDSEIKTLNAWVSGLPTDVPRVRSQSDIKAAREIVMPQKVSDPTAPIEVPDNEQTIGAFQKTVLPENLDAVNNSNLDPGNVRHLYHMLLNIETYPQSLDNAVDFIKTWLARATRNTQTDPLKIPFETYTHDALRNWFEAQGKAQSDSYTSSESVEIDKSRQEVIDEAVFLCPMILIDGGWIQNWTCPGLVDTKIGALLFKIFADEIGNGVEELNHPNVYRRLMQQMGVSVLDHRTLSFAESDHFEDDAFMVPTFWLAISHYPRRFLPETLGLNLAMELSGVGGAYLKARDELAHYGFSTLFVDLHNTIDNVSTGHSAMAAEAVVHHMDSIMRSGDINAVSRHWQRVWTGFRALAIPQPSWKEFFSKLVYSQ